MYVLTKSLSLTEWQQYYGAVFFKYVALFFVFTVLYCNRMHNAAMFNIPSDWVWYDTSEQI